MGNCDNTEYDDDTLGHCVDIIWHLCHKTRLWHQNRALGCHNMGTIGHFFVTKCHCDDTVEHDECTLWDFYNILGNFFHIVEDFRSKFQHNLDKN